MFSSVAIFASKKSLFEICDDVAVDFHVFKIGCDIIVYFARNDTDGIIAKFTNFVIYNLDFKKNIRHTRT